MKDISCDCGFNNKVSERQYRRHKGETMPCGSCGKPVKILTWGDAM